MFIFDYPEPLLAQHRRISARPIAPPPSYVGFGPRGPYLRLKDALAASEPLRDELKRQLLGPQIELNLSRDGVRQIITGRRIWITGADNSLKAGYPVHYEGPNERELVPHSDVDIGVLDIRSQPAEFGVFVDGEHKSYTTDFMRLVRPGRVEVIEVKSNPKSVAGDQKYRAKLAAVRSVCDVLGWNFRLVFGEDLKASTIFNYHVTEIFSLGMTAVPVGVATSVQRLISAGGGIASIGSIVDFAGGRIVGRAVVCALMCRGQIYFDLTQPLTVDTAVLSAMGV